MRNRYAFTLTTASLLAGLSLASCFSANGGNSDGDDGVVIAGGRPSGGSGGRAGSGPGADAGTGGQSGGASSAGKGGTGGGGTSSGGSSSVSAELGAACADSSDCDDGLSCIEATSDALGGGPPKGLCTKSCSTHETCLELAANALCVAFDGGSYCVEGCHPGVTPGGKCHEREEVVCGLVQMDPSSVSCERSDECASDEICSGGYCSTPITACLPQCGNDGDCPNGRYCNYSSGLCEGAVVPGKGFNEPCDTTIDGECNGVCIGSAEDPLVGTCGAFCSFGDVTSCGYDGEGAADTACLFPTTITPEPEINDLALCGQLCDCSDDCSLLGELCAPFGDVGVADLFGRAGYCRAVQPGVFEEADALSCG